MKILISGSSGFVGTHLTKKLLKKHEIVTYDLVNGQDVLNSNLLSQKLNGADLVIHLAAFISATESWKKPMDYMRNNALGTLSVIDCAIKSGVKKMIFFSSAAVKTKPLTPYAVSKIAAEEIVKLYSDKINVAIVRPENIYGPGQKEAYGYVIHNFINAVKEGHGINIYGDGNQTRDFIYIDDVVKTVEKLMETKIESGTVINLGTGKETKIIDLAKEVMKILNKKTKVNFSKIRNEPRRSVADIAVLSKLGINTKRFIGLEEGINKLV
jgi:nucleoside-diphosphate-sugar epimerase